MGEVRDSSSSARFAAPSALGGGEPFGNNANPPESGTGGRAIGGAMKYSLAASAAGEYDPTFVRLNRAEHQVRAFLFCDGKQTARLDQIGDDRVWLWVGIFWKGVGGICFLSHASWCNVRCPGDEACNPRTETCCSGRKHDKRRVVFSFFCNR